MERLVFCVKIRVTPNGHLYWWADALPIGMWDASGGHFSSWWDHLAREEPYLELFVRQHHKRVRAGVSDYIGIPYFNLETTSRLKN